MCPGIRVAKMSQKDEYRSKYNILRRKLRTILKKLPNDPGIYFYI